MKTIRNRNENGRPKVDDDIKKSRRVEILLSPNEYDTLRSKAQKAGLNTSQFIREIIGKSHVKERLSASHLKMIVQLTGMANNLNQLAKKANQAGYIVVKNEMNMMSNWIDNVIKSIENDG